jgi:hypothetical protein
VDRPAGVIERLKTFGLPVLLIHALFLAALFELLRRLFRNVGRGESFTPQSVRLVQIIGVSLMVFAFVAAIGKSWFGYEMYAVSPTTRGSRCPEHRCSCRRPSPRPGSEPASHSATRPS